MFKKLKRKVVDDEDTNHINIWNKYDFVMCGLGEKNKVLAVAGHIASCIKWSYQRIVRGF